ncbi:hypothetical protein K239x_14950 [Planctomycetes bacterium K23_9]|uniref:Uncharacterized protein n=1 Tax=Stieleria marina TaxID=1930275 RepID=A0A517NQZ6_9BACT|nr:hypothetical protein K239x_14950 [Planctomycetes bacterium K23_9]
MARRGLESEFIAWQRFARMGWWSSSRALRHRLAGGVCVLAQARRQIFRYFLKRLIPAATDGRKGAGKCRWGAKMSEQISLVRVRSNRIEFGTAFE